ncbi:MAG TPA: 50S ribosomal protein L21 [Lactobacillaceae bacterium]|jgi:large subunit ribosomal protein L21
MAKYAIIATGGKQYKVAEGDVIFVEKLDAAEGDKVVFDNIVLIDGQLNPEGVTVEGTVEKQGKQKKVITFKYRAKKGSHTKKGHRQPYTRVKIGAIA